MLHEASNSFLEQRICMIEAARTLNGWGFEIGTAWPEMSDALLIFQAINSETDDIPLGKVRDHWHLASLAAKDEEARKAEALYFDKASDGCRLVLALFAARDATDR